MYMSDYVAQLDAVLTSGGRKLLNDAGRISHDEAVKKAKSEYRKYQEITLTPVEKEYMEMVKKANDTAKKGTRNNKNG